MDNFTANILNVFNLATVDEHNHGLAWYNTARKECQQIADKTGLPLHIVVGVCAALSPTNKWERNITDCRNLCRAFVNGGYTDDIKVCTYSKMKEKAVLILQTAGTSDKTIHILNGAKIVDFYKCILGDNVCVIDGHAWCIANNDRRTMQEVPNIGKKLRQELQAAYAEAADKHNITAYEMQAITWVTWKRIWSV